jgi:putative MATE family efflux protein
MKDLTTGSISAHILRMSGVMAIGMIGQTLYILVDLYFVAGLGPDAVAGVGAAGNFSFIVFALTQILGVGTLALIAHAAGRKDQPAANLVFNQSIVLSAACAVAMLAAGYAITGPYMRSVAADGGTVAAGKSYLYWFLPGLALQFAMVSMGSALRGTGIVRPGMTVQLLTVVLNVILAPILIAGWGTGHPLGVAGAGLASSVSIAAGVVVLTVYFLKLEHYVGFNREMWRPQLTSWQRLLAIGLPAGGEFAFIFVFTSVMYWVIRNFGAEAQAGFGIGGRVMQSIFLPAMAVAFSAAPIAGQNFGALRPDRVRQTFKSAALIGTLIMGTATLFCQVAPQVLVAAFTSDARVIEVGAQFLRIASWNFIGNGLIFTCSGMFQAMGNTWPVLLSSGSRVLTFVVPAVWLSRQPYFRLEHVWYLSVVTIVLQAAVSLALLRRELRRKLAFAPSLSVQGSPSVPSAGSH